MNMGIYIVHPVAAEVVGLVVGDIGMTDIGRDIIIQHHSLELQRIHEKHRKFMAMQYPILFPYGEDGFHESIIYNQTTSSSALQRNKATVVEFFVYILHDRVGQFNTPLRCERLTQSYFVDGYCCVEGITAGSSAGQRVILPASHTGSPRYFYQNYQDCIAICRKYGCPDLFLTFTSNASWPEILQALPPRQQPSDRPDIVDRVFKMKLNILMDDITKNKFFGPIHAVVYTVEFQKRGLPHVHIIIWLSKEEPLDAQKVDQRISAQLPNPTLDTIGFEAVTSFMIHGPCGPGISYSPCMSGGRCSKFYPKEFYENTSILQNGFTQYARPNNGIVVTKNGVDIDNRFIVPHNVDLVVKYQAHINVESVNHDGMHKYLFKYVTKGYDCAKAGIRPNSGSETINEIDNYHECRCVTPNDAAWHLLQFDIHHTDPSVERLPVHLPLENNVVYTEDDDLEEVIENPGNQKSKLTAWLEANSQFHEAREHTYIEFPQYFTWHSSGKYWDIRRGYHNKIGRIAHVDPTKGEQYYLRMLLHIVKGPKAFSEIRNISGQQHPMFRSACEALGLLDDDQEWSYALNDAAQWALPYQLRQLFVTILLFCEVTNPQRLFTKHAQRLSEDIRHRANLNLSESNISLANSFVHNALLFELDKLLRNAGYSLSHFNLPLPDDIGSASADNRLLLDELGYDIIGITSTSANDINMLNRNQKEIFDSISNSVINNEGRTFFVYGYGETGKTFLWTTLWNFVRTQGKIALAVASSGIASLLLPGGRTPHSRFKIPLDIRDNSMCSIKKNTHLAELIQ
ncbi:uncharacterized protein LOC102712269 isoform X2 [Oryza brachyantha]|uniref:uncharacterized protein LOC102712269 isoform X2 n=1 Tax=Oryza brachyantha TaxID=4533 RepID=UPI001AD992CE|nr:uncharacterized protein LOC102712269 isoform X2 [Oryza brachyantha]